MLRPPDEDHTQRSQRARRTPRRQHKNWFCFLLCDLCALCGLCVVGISVGVAMSTMIKNGRVITATDDYIADIFIDGETISAIGTNLPMKADRTIDASGKLVIPGAIDPHVHMELPFGGTVSSDDFRTGTIAAAFGGTTTIIDFVPPNAAAMVPVLKSSD